MQLQAGVFPIHANDILDVVEVWEASVRATHFFVSEADIQFFKPWCEMASRRWQSLPAFVIAKVRSLVPSL